MDVPVATGVRFEDETGGRRRFWVEVQGKLHAGDQVVTSGQSQLADGTHAKVDFALAASRASRPTSALVRRATRQRKVVLLGEKKRFPATTG